MPDIFFFYYLFISIWLETPGGVYQYGTRIKLGWYFINMFLITGKKFQFVLFNGLP